jgi:hypothetical protein
MGEAWIGVDLDGTLAYYERGHFKMYGAYHIGEPIPAMVERVKKWLAEGIKVKIITARAYKCDSKTKTTIRNWCKEHIGQVLEITCTKDYDMIRLYDDRCVQVESNTGRLIGVEDE